LHDFGVWNGRPYLVLELLEGETLAARAARSPLTVDEVLDAAVQLARALVHAHASGVHHGDLKPANVLVTAEGTLKVLDFGLARVDDERATRAGGGTPGYIAPEVSRGEPADARADLFALGAVCFEMSCGRLPSLAPADEAALRAAGASAGMTRAVARLLEKDPSRRTASARAALDAFLEIGAAPSPGAGASPYRYLEPFAEADAGWFFGREREAVRLEHRVQSRSLVALAGPSGAGKSSLVAAGLSPRLRRRGFTVVALRPGPEPFARLRGRVAAACGLDLPDAAELEAKPGTLARALRAHGRRVVLAVDAFEELYTGRLEAATRRAYASALAACGDEAEGPLRVVLSLREDFLGRLGELPELLSLVEANLVLLPAPGPADLAEALAAPARRLGHELEAGLADEVVRELAGEAAPLPLLQLAASRLWEERDVDRRVLRRSTLEAMGGVAGILAAHANDVLAALPDGNAREVARRLLCRLVTGERTRRQVELEALLQAVPGGRPVLERLIAGRLVTSSRGDHETVELAHESLIARWALLGAWLAEDRELRAAGEAVAQAARFWHAEGRPRRLLLSGERLAEALRWRRGAARVEPVEEAFLVAAEIGAARARLARRLAVATSAVAAVAITAASVTAMRSYKADANAARVRALVTEAASAEDPLAGARILAGLARDGEPPSGTEAASRVARQPLPYRVFAAPAEPWDLGFARDGRVAVSFANGDVRVFRLDDPGPAGDPAPPRGCAWQHVHLRWDVARDLVRGWARPCVARRRKRRAARAAACRARAGAAAARAGRAARRQRGERRHGPHPRSGRRRSAVGARRPSRHGLVDELQRRRRAARHGQ
jgi:hypothetical protein